MQNNIDGEGKGRDDSDQDATSLDIVILPDGRVLLPRNASLASIAAALGDKDAELFCQQAKMTDVIIGKRMCG